MIKITECPRDAMQGIKAFIPTNVKAHYLNLLLKVGFDRLDFGSFVSPKVTPQMRDTHQIVDLLDTHSSATSLLAIIANIRGAQDAVHHKKIKILGFPFSVSETFQVKNTNSTREQSLHSIKEIVSICQDNDKVPLVYLSMGFGNPYGEEWNADIVSEYTEKIIRLGVNEIMLSDTTGESSVEKIDYLFPLLKNYFPTASLGLHLHSKVEDTDAKLQTALNLGCTRFDTAIRGFGGCPMAKDDLIGNIATESLLSLLKRNNLPNRLNKKAWDEAFDYSWKVFKS